MSINQWNKKLTKEILRSNISFDRLSILCSEKKPIKSDLGSLSNDSSNLFEEGNRRISDIVIPGRETISENSIVEYF